MSDVALRMEHVYKKFQKGEIYNSLRDLIARNDRKDASRQDLDPTIRASSGRCRTYRSK